MITHHDIQGTVGWLTSRIALSTEHAIRKELRAIERLAHATLVVLYVRVGVAEREVIASAGEFTTVPIRLPEMDCTKPSFETVRVDAGRVSSQSAIWSSSDNPCSG